MIFFNIAAYEKSCISLALVVKSSALRELLALRSRNKAGHFLGETESLRNTLVQCQYDLISAGSWTDLVTMIQRIEATIEISDIAAERRAVEFSSMDL